MNNNKKTILHRDRVIDNPINVIHLGLGAFYRAFACSYFQRMNEIKSGSVRVMGVSLRNPGLIRVLERQGGLFTAVEKGPKGQVPRILDSIHEVIFAPDDPLYLLSSLADPSVSLVTLTVTEKGYCLVPSSGELNFEHPDILYDIGHAETPRSAIGYLVHALNLRRKKGILPFTCLSCDNLPSNGVVLGNAVRQFAKRINSELFDWISDNVIFPSSMVDRIVPSISSNEVDLLQEILPYKDDSPIIHEPYSLWVIENKFVEGLKLNFEAAGVYVVPDVQLFERMKLRCLNGTHSALAYLGYLAGFKTIFEVASDPVFEIFLISIWANEIIPGVEPPPNFILSDYSKELLVRYKNPNIEHLTKQIAMDGSQKLPQRILETIDENLQNNRPIDLLCEAVVGWIRYTGGKDEFGTKIDVVDPNAYELFNAHQASKNIEDLIVRYLDFDNIFSKNLRESLVFKLKLEQGLERHQRLGTLKSLGEVLK